MVDLIEAPLYCYKVGGYNIFLQTRGILSAVESNCMQMESIETAELIVLSTVLFLKEFNLNRCPYDLSSLELKITQGRHCGEWGSTKKKVFTF